MRNTCNLLHVLDISIFVLIEKRVVPIYGEIQEVKWVFLRVEIESSIEKKT
jgi:hypothetical protein